jgi:ABC-type phosphate transport system substrate-binding protein
MGMHKIGKRTLAVAAGAVAMGMGLPLLSAQADSAPQPSDVVGIGSDTVQYLVDFGADGDTLGDGGYNSAGNLNRLYSFDATPDANARAGYLNGSTNTTLKALNPTIVLRAGTSPILRPNGSGAGISALLADTAGEISYVRSSRPLKGSEETTAVATSGVGALHTVQLGTDGLEIAVATSTHAPALSAQELVSIYQGTITKWNQLPGNSGGSAATIIPLIPQNGSGTRSTFLADLQAANGGTAITLGSSVQTVEENDPTSVTLSTSPADAIDPFSSGRLALYSSGYFHDPSVAYPGGGSLAPGIKLLTGTPGDSNGIYDDERGLYVIFRQSDFTSSTPWQPGTTKNWVNTLFAASSGTPFFKSAAGQSLVAAAGATPGYADKGVGFTVG